MTTPNLDDEWHGLRCDVQRSVRYHMARVRFYQSWSSLFSFLALISGSSVVVAILAEAPEWIALTAGAVIAGTQALDMVIGLAGKARMHAALASRFSGIEQALTLADGDQDAGTLRRLKAELLQVEAGEPPVLRWLNAICHNEVAIAIGSKDVYHVPLWARLGAQFLPGAGIRPKRIPA